MIKPPLHEETIQSDTPNLTYVIRVYSYPSLGRHTWHAERLYGDRCTHIAGGHVEWETTPNAALERAKNAGREAVAMYRQYTKGFGEC